MLWQAGPESLWRAGADGAETVSEATSPTEVAATTIQRCIHAGPRSRCSPSRPLLTLCSSPGVDRLAHARVGQDGRARAQAAMAHTVHPLSNSARTLHASRARFSLMVCALCVGCRQAAQDTQARRPVARGADGARARGPRAQRPATHDAHAACAGTTTDQTRDFCSQRAHSDGALLDAHDARAGSVTRARVETARA
jgi:hypothetical protein